MNEQFTGIMEGLNDLLEYAKGNTTKARTRVVESRDVTILPLKKFNKEEIKQIRLNNQLTLKSFASCLGVSQKTVECWETGTNRPSGASVRLLQILEKKPDALSVLEIIRSRAG
jgi:putative transcriptional regulator